LTLHCIRFWYGNEGGNRNNFDTKEACNEVCVEPEGKKVRNSLWIKEKKKNLKRGQEKCQ
jgi:hypothetical protein